MNIPFPPLPKTNLPELECRITEAVASVTSNTEAKVWEETILKRCRLCNSNGVHLGFTENLHILCTDLCNALIMNITSELCILDSVCFFLNCPIFSVSR